MVLYCTINSYEQVDRGIGFGLLAPNCSTELESLSTEWKLQVRIAVARTILTMDAVKAHPYQPADTRMFD